MLNRDDRPNAGIGRSMCVGDIVVIADARTSAPEACGPRSVWIARMVGWEELRSPRDEAVDCFHWSNTAFLRRCALEGEMIEEAQTVTETI